MAFSMPNDKVTHRVTDLMQEVRKADKNYDVESRQSPEYEFGRRRFERVNKNFRQYSAAEGGTP